MTNRLLDHRLFEVATLHTVAPRVFDRTVAARIEEALRVPRPIAIEGAARTGKVTAAIAAIVASGEAAIAVDLELLLAGADPVGKLALARRETELATKLVLRTSRWDARWSIGVRRSLCELVMSGRAVLAMRDSRQVPFEAQRIEVAMPDASTQAGVWRSIVGDVPELAQVCARYPLALGDIAIAATEVRAETMLAGRAPLLADLLVAARVQLRQRLGDAAELVSTRLSLSDVICDAAVVCDFVELARRESATAVISGPPGSGKTMIAAAIGKQLGREVFRVAHYRSDLESQLALVFEEARRHSAILVFDDADAVFSKRSAAALLVRHLARHVGVVVLAISTDALDPAVLRDTNRIALAAPDEPERARRTAAVQAAYRTRAA